MQILRFWKAISPGAKATRKELAWRKNPHIEFPRQSKRRNVPDIHSRARQKAVFPWFAWTKNRQGSWHSNMHGQYYKTKRKKIDMPKIVNLDMPSNGFLSRLLHWKIETRLPQNFTPIAKSPINPSTYKIKIIQGAIRFAKRLHRNPLNCYQGNQSSHQ